MHYGPLFLVRARSSQEDTAWTPSAPISDRFYVTNGEDANAFNRTHRHRFSKTRHICIPHKRTADARQFSMPPSAAGFDVMLPKDLRFELACLASCCEGKIRNMSIRTSTKSSIFNRLISISLLIKSASLFGQTSNARHISPTLSMSVFKRDFRLNWSRSTAG